MEEINLDNLDKNKVYCNGCIKLNTITELKVDKDTGICCAPKCIHCKSRNKYILLFRNDWITIRGFDINSISESERSKLRMCKGVCSICGKISEHRDNCSRGVECGCHDKWYLEHNSSKLMRDASSTNMYNKHKNGIMDNVLNKLNSEHKEFCIKCDKLTRNNEYGTCLECNFIFNFKPSFIFKDGLKYYYSYNDNNYILWSDYKETFEAQQMSKIPNFIDIPTFRTQNSDTWNGSKVAFEQYLVDLNITWFVYIKYYITKSGQLKPLVVGKSGSKLVNSNGSDLSFSTEVDHGPSRRFLYENNLEWCKTKISIMSFEFEYNALNKEKEILKEFRLFGS